MLTDTRVKTAKPQDKIFKLTDERGLHLSVYPNGSKLWQMRYRFEGKQKTASIGKYPEVSLAEAREKRDQMRKQVPACELVLPTVCLPLLLRPITLSEQLLAA